jgi:hypothetical protein
VHYSSGPNNRMFYFLSQGSNASRSSDYYSSYLTKTPLAMTGIGTTRPTASGSRPTTKFTSATNYADARNKVLAAAQELYGVGSKEAIAVQRAYAAINVGPTSTKPPASSAATAGQTAYEGTRFAWLGGNGTTASETITQAVVIPSAATSAQLTFALHIDTAETGSTVYDKLVVTVKNSVRHGARHAGHVLQREQGAGYQIRSFSLLPYKGQTVTLSFAMTEDSSLQTRSWSTR